MDCYDQLFGRFAGYSILRPGTVSNRARELRETRDGLQLYSSAGMVVTVSPAGRLSSPIPTCLTWAQDLDQADEIFRQHLARFVPAGATIHPNSREEL